MYLKRSTHGGAITILVLLAMVIMFFVEVQVYLFGKPDFSFNIDNHIGHLMQLNLDVTVATPCSKISIDLRDASGDALHYSLNDIVKDPTIFRQEKARVLKRNNYFSLAKLTHGQYKNRKKIARQDKKSVKGGPRHKDSGFEETDMSFAETAPACRVYGSINVKKVTGNLHISTFVPSFISGAAHHDLGINMSHIIHEFSFGDYFPDIAEPLDSSMELTDDPVAVYQYFISVVPTKYMAGGRVLDTNQYSVTDYKRNPTGQTTFPGLYFKYDIEPLTMKVSKHSISFVAFIIRITSVLGGVWICTNLALRVLNRVMTVYRRYLRGAALNIAKPSSTPSTFNQPFMSGPTIPMQTSGYESYSASAPNFVVHGPSQTKYRSANY